MSTDSDTSAPVYGPPNRNNYAEWMRECPSERPLPATVQASKDHFQRALVGCHLPPVPALVDGAVAASLTFREQRPPKPPFRCPDRCADASLAFVFYNCREAAVTTRNVDFATRDVVGTVNYSEAQYIRC